MAFATIFPNAITAVTGGDWPNGSAADIDEGITAADGTLLTTTTDGEGEGVDIGFASPGLVDGDTITALTLTLRHIEGLVAGDTDSQIDVSLYINSVVQGTPQGQAHRASLFDETITDATFWDIDWTAAQIDSVEVRVVCTQGGKPTADQWGIDTAEILIEYTPAASGGGAPVFLHHLKQMAGA